MGAIARLAQVVHRAPRDHFAPMPQEGIQHFLERHQLGLAVLQGHHVDAEHGFQRRLRVQVVEHDFGDFAAPQLHDNAHAVLVGLVTQAVAGNALDLLLAHQVGDALDQPRLVDLVGQLGDDDGLAPALFQILEVGAAAYGQPSAAGLVGHDDFVGAIDDAGGGEIRSRDVRHQLHQRDFRIVEHRQQRIDHFGQVVRRDVGGHAHGNARGAIDQQVGHPGRQHRRLMLGFVVVGDEIHGLAIDVGQQLVGELRHAHFGVAHGRRHVAVHRAEVALPVHQHVAHGKRLGHAHDGVIDRGIAVRVVLADHVADDAGGLLVGLVVVVAQLAHGEQHAPVHGLEAIAHVGQRPADDHAHGVIEVGLAHLVFEIYRQDFPGNFTHVLRSSAPRFKPRILAQKALRTEPESAPESLYWRP